MKKISCLVLALAVMVSAASAAEVAAKKRPPTMLRVLVADDKNVIELAVRGRYWISEVESGKILYEGEYFRTKVGIAKEGILVDKTAVKGLGIKVKTAKSAAISIDGRQFRGEIDITRKDDLTLNLINNVELENYLYGVLYHEVSHRWPIEVLKAQSIAARTFALHQREQSKLAPYDLRNDIYSQMYGGKTSEKWSTTRAVNLTKGKVLVYNGGLLPAYYHATCAGRTEDASNLWNIDLAPLKGVECKYCKDSPHYKWHKEISLWEIENRLKANDYNIGKIASLNILSRNKSGRVDKLEIKGESGASLILTGKDFRQMIGPNDVRSTNFTISLKWEHAIFDGYGWGHGVGLCQWGAYGLGRRGKKAEEILKFYYPGTEIATQ